MDGQVDIELYNPSALSSTLKGKNISTASYDGTGKTCTSVYCHSSGQAEPVRTYKNISRLGQFIREYPGRPQMQQMP